MKSKKFEIAFVVAAWIIFMASNQNVYSAILLMCAGMYMLVNVIARLKKKRR